MTRMFLLVVLGAMVLPTWENTAQAQSRPEIERLRARYTHDHQNFRRMRRAQRRAERNHYKMLRLQNHQRRLEGRRAYWQERGRLWNGGGGYGNSYGGYPDGYRGPVRPGLNYYQEVPPHPGAYPMTRPPRYHQPPPQVIVVRESPPPPTRKVVVVKKIVTQPPRPPSPEDKTLADARAKQCVDRFGGNEDLSLLYACMGMTQP